MLLVTCFLLRLLSGMDFAGVSLLAPTEAEAGPSQNDVQGLSQGLRCISAKRKRESEESEAEDQGEKKQKTLDSEDKPNLRLRAKFVVTKTLAFAKVVEISAKLSSNCRLRFDASGMYWVAEHRVDRRSKRADCWIEQKLHKSFFASVDCPEDLVLPVNMDSLHNMIALCLLCDPNYLTLEVWSTPQGLIVKGTSFSENKAELDSHILPATNGQDEGQAFPESDGVYPVQVFINCKLFETKLVRLNKFIASKDGQLSIMYDPANKALKLVSDNPQTGSCSAISFNPQNGLVFGPEPEPKQQVEGKILETVIPVNPLLSFLKARCVNPMMKMFLPADDAPVIFEYTLGTGKDPGDDSFIRLFVRNSCIL